VRDKSIEVVSDSVWGPAATFKYMNYERIFIIVVPSHAHVNSAITPGLRQCMQEHVSVHASLYLSPTTDRAITHLGHSPCSNVAGTVIK
jgi:hypothetical protein